MDVVKMGRIRGPNLLTYPSDPVNSEVYIRFSSTDVGIPGSRDDQYKGVALWAIHPDGSRLEALTEPLHFPGYLAELWDFEDTNVVAATNQVTVADIAPERVQIQSEHLMIVTLQECWGDQFCLRRNSEMSEKAVHGSELGT